MKTTDTTAFGMSDFYKTVGGDMNDVLDRLEDIDMVKENLLDFSEDVSYSELLQCLGDNDIKGAFRAAHTLKGICYTFGIGRLGDDASAVCEELRHGVPPSREMTERLAEEYRRTLEALGRLKDGR